MVYWAWALKAILSIYSYFIGGSMSHDSPKFKGRGNAILLFAVGENQKDNKWFRDEWLTYPSQLCFEVGPVIIYIFQMRKPRLREVRQLAQGHTALKSLSKEIL